MRTKRKKHARPQPSGGAVSAREAHRGRRERAALSWAVAVVAAAIAVYLNAFGHEFLLDDIRLVRDNERIRSLANVPRLFASSYWEMEGAQALYRPLVLATYAVNYTVHGLWTDGYAAVNIALHASVSLLLFTLVRAIGGTPFAAGVAGIAFAVHPVHTEAVTAISGRAELLAALFFLVAIHLHRLAPRAGRVSLACRLGVLACFGAALLSKESAITLLLVVPVMDALLPSTDAKGQRVPLRARVLADYLPLACVALVYVAVRRAVLGDITIDESLIAPLDNPLVPVTTLPLGEQAGATTGQAIMTAFAVVVEYARLVAWPARLSPDYSYAQIPLVTSAIDPRFMGGVALVAGCIAGIVLLWRRSRTAAFGLAFLALTYAIVSNFVVTIGTICAERLIYLPSAGALIAAAVGTEWLAGRTTSTRQRLVFGILVVLALAGAARTWTRNRDWANELTLWSSAARTSPRSARVQSEYARVLIELAEREARDGRRTEAERLYRDAQLHFETALGIYPSYSPAIDGLAMIHSLHDRFDEAAVLYARALKAWPGNYASLANWGSLLWEQCRRGARSSLKLRQEGRVSEADAVMRDADATCREALETVDRAIATMPSYAHAHLVRAQILDVYGGDRAGAIAEFEEVLRLMPNHPERALIERELQRLRSAVPR